MSYEFYKILHILSVILVFVALTGYVYSGRKTFGMIHGIALLTLLVSGFGLAARLGLMSGLPTWVWIKLTVWVVLGAAIAIAKRKMLSPKIQISLWILFGFVAVFSAVTKPLL